MAFADGDAASKPISWSSPPASGPTSNSARKAGLNVNRGIVVNDYMETSHPDIFAVGECVEHNGICYGLVAPLLEQGKVLAATITGNKGPTYTGTVPAAKLKIMGVDVFSAGDWSETARAPSRCASKIRALGIYKKLLLRDGKLAGVILVGDTSDSHRYMDWLRTGRRTSPAQRRHLLFPPPGADAGLDIAQMADSATDLRLHRRHQGRDHPGHPREGRQHAVAAEGGDARQHRLRQLHGALPGRCCRPSRRSSRRTPRRCCAAACRSRRRTCARSCAASA